LAIELIASSLVIDMLGLLTLDYSKLIGWQTSAEGFRPEDLNRLKQSGNRYIYNGFPSRSRVCRGRYLQCLAAKRDALGTLSLLRMREDFLRVDDAAGLQRAKDARKIGILIGLQNSAHFRTVEDLDHFLRPWPKGVVATDLWSQPAWRAVRRTTPTKALNRFRCAHRRAHESHGHGHRHFALQRPHGRLMRSKASRKPVLVTHSNCRYLVPGSARCKDRRRDPEKMGAKGGVMGVTMVAILRRQSYGVHRRVCWTISITSRQLPESSMSGSEPMSI